MRGDPLASLQCPKGCSTRFIQYLCYEGTDDDGKGGLRICEELELGGVPQNVYQMGLRCSDCGTHYGRRPVPKKVKNALDDHLEAVAHLLQDLADEADTEQVKALLGDTAEIMEEKPDA